MSRGVLRLSIAGVALAAGGAAGTAWLLEGGGAPARAATPSSPVSTAEVVRRTLTERQSFDGSLAYADPRTLAGSGHGTITGLPAEGTILRRGDRLYGVDGLPVLLFYGSTPAWRTLQSGVDDGRDVYQLEKNLRALGYDTGHDMTVDEHWDWATTAAVKRWQDDHGLDDTGVVELGRVVFLPGPRRVGTLKAALGGPAGGPVMTTTATAREVTFQLDVDLQQAVHDGSSVRVQLPSGAFTAGVVEDVGTVATTDQESGSSTVDVTVELQGGRTVTRLDQAPVTVEVTRARHAMVTAVPVTALLATLGGGYAVELASTRKLVAIEAGTFADGYVELVGSALKPGTKVVTSQ